MNTLDTRFVTRPTFAAQPGNPMVLPLRTALALRPEVDAWDKATDCARITATHRLVVVGYLKDYTDCGVTQAQAISHLLTKQDNGTLPATVAASLVASGRKGRLPSISTLAQWCKAYKDAGYNRVGLLSNYQGRVVPPQDWWAQAMHYHNQPGKPSYMAVTRWLVDVQGFDVSVDQVKRYLQSLPAQYGAKGVARLGGNLHKLTQKPYHTRTTENLSPGDIYAADGYSVDVYLAHPVTGKIWRMEMTAAIDVRSRYPVGWRADDHEGTTAVQNMWAEAFDRHQHLPLKLYVDNGSGHKNKLMSSDVTGFYARAGVEVIHAIPGNPHGKGWIERFFRTVRDDFLKLWRPAFYCGNDMSKDALDKTCREVNAGRLALPTLAEFTHDFNLWLKSYVQRPHPEKNAGGLSIADIWADLKPVMPMHSLIEFKRQVALLSVRRARVVHQNREYTHAELYAFNGQKVQLEYDMEDDRVAIVRTEQGIWICDAHLVTAMDVLAPSRKAEAEQRRVQGQIKRSELKIAEQKARAGLVIDVDAVAMGGMAAIEGSSTRIEDGSADTFSLDDFND